MDSCDDDMFAFNDDELPISTPKCNPVEEHLMKQLSDVETRIEKTINDIREVRNATRHILKSLYNQAQYGEDVTSDSDSDFYNIEGEPVVKKKKSKVPKPKQKLIIKNNWIRIVCDQWVIGVELENTLAEILNHIQIYISIKDEDEISGTSMFWYLKSDTLWSLTDVIEPHQVVVATVALDLPKFDKNPFCDAYGTVSYEIEEREYQTPLPIIRLMIQEIIENNYAIKFSSQLNESILALKTTSVEKTFIIQIEKHTGRGTQLLKFLEETSFKEILADVYVVKATGCLMYCLVEILPIVDGEARLKIYSRSNQQMNIMTRLLRDQFPDVIIEEEINPVHAATALIEELKLYLGNASTAERQIARLKTDLLIP